MTAAARVLVVGAGLTGCSVAHRLAEHGVEAVVLERSEAPGGLIRSDHMNGVLFEPHGSHIFHTDDDEVWALANRMTPFRPYRHRVDIAVDGGLYNWPILLSDIKAQSRGDEILAELEARRGVDPDARAHAADFEEWCLDLMGPILYERYVRPYTEKQWGRPARELSARWAPRRVGVRWDDDPYLFHDRHQGWPAGPNGYTDLIDGLLSPSSVTLRTRVEVTLANLSEHARRERAGAVVLTCPLDELCAHRLGRLEWRGIAVRSVHVPEREYAQGAMVVNYPGPEYPFIRIHETKHASGQRCAGTVLGFEFTGAPGRHYPVDTDRNRALNDRYQDYVRAALRPTPAFFAGRLASYVYADMDDCMRQGLDVADRVPASLQELGTTAHRSPPPRGAPARDGRR